MIPLYLDGTVEPLAVVLDGPALRLRRAAACDQPVPLGRLARIVVRGDVTWAGGALGACLRHGIPMLFLDGEGRPLGSCLPETPRASDLAALLDGLSMLGGLEPVHDAWRRAAQRRAILRLALRVRLVPDDLRPAVVRRRLLAELERRLGAAPEEAPEQAGAEALATRVEALVLAFVGDRLLAEGLGARFQGAEPGLDLRRELGALLGLELWPTVLRLGDYLRAHAGKHRDERSRQRRVVRWIEAETPRLERALARELALLRSTLREALA